MPRSFLPAILLLTLGGAGCSKQGAPEQVADAFADAYFRQMDQEKAKEFTALGASTMLDVEIREVQKIRKEGYGPDDAASSVVVRRGDATPREQRLRYPYEIVVQVDGSEITRKADVELAQIDGVWKVVRVGVDPR